MKKWILILIPIILLIIYFIFRTPSAPQNEVSQKPVYKAGTPEYIERAHQELIERGESGQVDIWKLKLEKSALSDIHHQAVKCVSLKSEKPIGPVMLIFSINADGVLNNFELDPPISGSQLDQACLTAAYSSMGPQNHGRKTDQWGRDRFQASEFVNQN